MHFMSPCQCLTFTLNDLTHQQLGRKYFVQTPKNRSEKGTRPSARLFFCLLQVIHLLTYIIYYIHLGLLNEASACMFVMVILHLV